MKYCFCLAICTHFLLWPCLVSESDHAELIDYPMVKRHSVSPLATCLLRVLNFASSTSWPSWRAAQRLAGSRMDDALDLQVESKKSGRSDHLSRMDRRDLLLRTSRLLLFGHLLRPSTSAADEMGSDMQLISDADFAYQLVIPKDWQNKPKLLQTHKHENNFAGDRKVGLKVGIAVDPTKIKSLEEFGTPEQVAEKIIATEKNRDGVKDVTLRQVASLPGPPTYYTLEYLTNSKRGNKVVCCKFAITSRGLYTLEAQAKVDAFDSPDDASVRETIRGIVDSFEISAA